MSKHKSVFCKGSECSKRDLCKNHLYIDITDKSYINNPREVLDYSTQEASKYEVDYMCGDKGDFKLFNPIITKTEKQDMKCDQINKIYRIKFIACEIAGTEEFEDVLFVTAPSEREAHAKLSDFLKGKRLCFHLLSSREVVDPVFNVDIGFDRCPNEYKFNKKEK